MRVSNVARVVRTSMLAAIVALPVLAAACAEPLAPTVQAPRVSSDAAHNDTTGRSGATLPWYDNEPVQKSGATLPWY